MIEMIEDLGGREILLIRLGLRNVIITALDFGLKKQRMNFTFFACDVTGVRTVNINEELKMDKVKERCNRRTPIK
jgi:hypothetical protein